MEVFIDIPPNTGYLDIPIVRQHRFDDPAHVLIGLTLTENDFWATIA